MQITRPIRNKDRFNKKYANSYKNRDRRVRGKQTIEVYITKMYSTNKIG